MEVGAVGYHNQSERKLVKDVKTDKSIVKVLAKTKKEEYPNLE